MLTTGVVVRTRLVVTNNQFDTFMGASVPSPLFSISVVDVPERRRHPARG